MHKKKRELSHVLMQSPIDSEKSESKSTTPEHLIIPVSFCFTILISMFQKFRFGWLDFPIFVGTALFFLQAAAPLRPDGEADVGADLLLLVCPFGRDGFSINGYTLENERLEPENHLFEKENHLPNLHDFGFHVNFQGCT